jgi:neutral trehalase
MLGDEQGAEKQETEADTYGQHMVEVLYDQDAGVFWDIHVQSGEPVKIKTPACLLPLLADVPLAAEEQERMIKDILLSPDLFFGDVPFPSVAYNESCYQSQQWWRGPTWLPVAYLLVQVLDKYGYNEQALTARQRLYRMVIKDGNLRELFNSRTGEGMGAYQQGWTAAICLQLYHELKATM